MVDFPYPLSMGGGKWVWVESWVIGERADHLLGKLSILAVQPWDMQKVTFLVCASGFFSLCFGLQLNSTRTSLNTSSTTMTYWQHWWPVEEGFPNKRHHGFCVWAIYDHPCQIYVDPDHFKYRSPWTSLTPQKKIQLRTVLGFNVNASAPYAKNSQKQRCSACFEIPRHPQGNLAAW
jgi:hypothetical protein